MGITGDWLRRWQAADDDVPAAAELPHRPRPLTAAGRRVDLSNPSPTLLRRKDWQAAAWGYRDTVPELRFVTGFIAYALGRLRVFPAVNQREGREPIPLQEGGTDGVSAATAAAARAAIARINLDVRGSSLLARLGENLEVAAEGYLLGEPDPDSPTGESWSVRSVTEISVTNDGRIRLIEPGARSTTGGGGRELDPDQVELLRVWRPHPQYYDWPDSELASALDTAEELRLIDRLMRASTRSRISSGQILYVPDEFSLSRPGGAPVQASVPGAAEDDDPFMDELVNSMIEPIQNEDAPEAVVPLLMRGPGLIQDKAAKDLLGAVPIPREDPAELNDRRDRKVAVLARALNIPPEVMTGLSVGNHWSSWLISADTVRNHIEPRAEVLCDSLTSAYLRPMLREMGCPPDEVERVVLWFDPAELVQNPNRGQDARDAHAAGTLSDEALVRHLGFADDERPKLNERLFRALESRAISDQQVPLMLALAGMEEDHPIMRAAVAAAKAGRAQRAPQIVNGAPTVDGGGGDPPSGEPPAEPGPPPAPAPINAAGPPRRRNTYRVVERACADLGRIDAQLITELLAHADATVGRAVERAANRARARAQRDPEMVAAFRDRPAVEVCAELGDRLGPYSEETDLTGSTDQLRELWLGAIQAAAEAIAEVVAAMLGVGARDEQLVSRLEAEARAAWPQLDQELRTLIRDVLAGRVAPRLDRGEAPAGPVPARMLRTALARAGGMPPESAGVAARGQRHLSGAGNALRGLATGEVVAEVVRSNGGAELGYEWQYYGIHRVPFLPHRELSGKRFASWTDDVLATEPQDRGWIGSHYSPGDHDGCLCGFFPIWAVPMDPDEPRAQADASALTERDSQVESRILMAEIDDLYPGRGTLPDGRTHAQAQRDLHEELVELRERHINARETP
ncbi:hypothetical protein [Pseudonocardia sp. NPDC049635]|uniref:hypothetical protein n=1 Tax=Pseudonocardia sp. NPDC049635 TaxID=3155506 RepID=UPI0033C352B5